MTVVAERPLVTDEKTGEDFYTYPPTGELLDRVSTIIDRTNSKPWIAKWHASTSAAWCVDNLALLARTLKADGRDAAIALGKVAAEQLRNVKSETGSLVHDFVERLVLWAASPEGTGHQISLPLIPDHLKHALYDDDPLPAVADFMVTGFMQFVADFEPEFLATEMTVFNQPLGVAGTLDMIVRLCGYAICQDRNCPRYQAHAVASPGSVLVVCVDVKTGKNTEGTWKEQLAAYRRMRECLLPMGDLHPMPATDCGAVLHLRPDYPGGYLLMLVSASNDAAAWNRFRRSARTYRERQEVKDKPGASIRALRPDGTMPGPRLCDLAGEGYGRALSPLSKSLGADAELATIARFTAVEILAIKGIGPKLLDTTRQALAENGYCLAGEELAFVLNAVRESAGQEIH